MSKVGRRNRPFVKLKGESIKIVVLFMDIRFFHEFLHSLRNVLPFVPIKMYRERTVTYNL